jgi:beta-D-galactosyl-(1->4)-L-rhamnose phosphorylase
VFFDDSWVGVEPFGGGFKDAGFDGLIKCVFSGYEARMCAEVPVAAHELRFHPYLFPVGLGGAPTFSRGGKPGEDALDYWVSVRRALLRKPVGRCGLGGYLHLVQDYPDFVNAVDTILQEFDAINGLHQSGAPFSAKPRVGVLHAWGKLRTWTLSGHFHETDSHVLIHLLEALSGLPFEVSFLSFDDIRDGVPGGIDILINAGEAGDAWSGGDFWRDDGLVDTLTAWVHGGGVYFGVGAPSAVSGYHTFLRMAHVLGVDLDDGERACHGRWAFDVQAIPGIVFTSPARRGVILTDGTARVLAASEGTPSVTTHTFGKGKGVYLAGFAAGPVSARALHNLLLCAAGTEADGVPDNPFIECAAFPGKLAFVNNSTDPQAAVCTWNGKRYEVALPPRGMAAVDL